MCDLLLHGSVSAAKVDYARCDMDEKCAVRA
jgi:hypothetical protein